MNVTCPRCQTGTTVGDEWFGRQFTCPSCQYTFLTSGDASGASGGFPAAGLAGSVCAECGTATPASEMVSFGGVTICARCKPIYVQKLKEGVTIASRFEYGRFWPRFVAKSIDQMIEAVAGFLLSVALIAVLGASSLVGEILVQIVMFGLGIVYTTWFVGRFGATPGKMALGLKVVKADGSRLTYMQALGRYFAEILSGIILGIGYIMAAFDEESRALHDRICDTRVIKA